MRVQAKAKVIQTKQQLQAAKVQVKAAARKVKAIGMEIKGAKANVKKTAAALQEDKENNHDTTAATAALKHAESHLQALQKAELAALKLHAKAKKNMVVSQAKAVAATKVRRAWSIFIFCSFATCQYNIHLKNTHTTI